MDIYSVYIHTDINFFHCSHVYTHTLIYTLCINTVLHQLILCAILLDSVKLKFEEYNWLSFYYYLFFFYTHLTTIHGV